MNNDTTWGEVELHLLVTAISPQLREYISTNAKASVRSPQHASKAFVFSALQDQSMVKEMESLCRDAASFVSKRCEKMQGITSYNVHERLVAVIEQVQRESKADRAECEKRLAKRQRFLQSMLLFDIIGSVESVDPVMRLSSRPGFTVEIDDVWNDNTGATMSLIDSGTLPESFTVSPRTLVMLRKIVQPLADAKSAYFEFTKAGSCNMRLRGTPPAREFIRREARIQEA